MDSINSMALADEADAASEMSGWAADGRMVRLDVRAAFELHQAGRLADAARVYQGLLDQNPDDPNVLHLFGVLHQQSGYSERAVELIQQAIEQCSDEASFHSNLSEPQRTLGRLDEAAASAREALRLRPDYPEALNNLGLALHELGRHEEAISQYETALSLQPDFAMAQNNRGSALRALGRMDEAVEAYRAALQLEPKLARAHANLGQLLAEQGRLIEALSHCRDAVKYQPNLPAGHNSLGNVLLLLQRWAEAADAFVMAVRLQPGLATAQANLGLALRQQGQTAAALSCLSRAVELAPDDVASWRQLGDAQVFAEDWDGAIQTFSRCCELLPGDADHHCQLGWAYQSCLPAGRMKEAEAAYRRALELQPDHFETLLNLGFLHEQLGAMTEAEACYRAAEAGHPQEPLALCRRAELMRERLPEADRDRLRFALYGDLELSERTNLLFALARVADSREDYSEAAAASDAANVLDNERRRSRGQSYDADEHSREVDRMIAAFTPELFERLAGAGDETAQPVFVFGLPRSGTTLVEQVLASHSQVFGAGELTLAAQAMKSLKGADDGLLIGLDGESLQRLARGYLDGVEAVLERASARRLGFHPDQTAACERVGMESQPTMRVVDKLPDNYLMLGLIALMFPRAKLIHVRRDVRDVAVSCWMTNFQTLRWANDQEVIARRIDDYRRIMGHWSAVLPLPIHEVSYEQLVEDIETQARRLVAACDLDWEPACLRFHEAARPVRTSSHTQVRQPLYRKSLDRWKHYEPYWGDWFKRLIDGS